MASLVLSPIHAPKIALALRSLAANPNEWPQNPIPAHESCWASVLPLFLLLASILLVLKAAEAKLSGVQQEPNEHRVKLCKDKAEPCWGGSRHRHVKN